MGISLTVNGTQSRWDRPLVPSRTESQMLSACAFETSHLREND